MCVCVCVPKLQNKISGYIRNKMITRQKYIITFIVSEELVIIIIRVSQIKVNIKIFSTLKAKSTDDKDYIFCLFS